MHHDHLSRTTVRSTGHFVLHVGEMLLAMAVGMALFGALIGGVLVAADTDFEEALEAAPARIALVLMFNMTVPMVAVMLLHRDAYSGWSERRYRIAV